ncbi:TPA: restriction endonuclease subunit S [Campylobacter jejuni]|nr:restriction endonuclease subunit S [Campylobacter jejuni]HDZ4951020.1 restriction endonuclease subunit S [Campylobacter jejuni]HDZ4958753.1 restriction endonuclease subunit S [Campylobacter jejuni]
MINETITKGLDKNINFKDSGIEHLGEIPQHWKVRRLSTFGKFSKGGNISRQDLVESGDSALLYGDIYMNYEISTSFLNSKISKNTSLGAIPIYEGDILFAGSGETKEDIGKNIVYLGKDKAFAGGDVIIFRQKENSALFLSYALNTKYVKFYKGIESKGEIIVHIYASNLKDIKIPLPPLKEQEQIANFLDSEISKIDKIIEKIKKQIELIKEYKTTLINQAVCGRINL